jgi:hypothetical protein
LPASGSGACSFCRAASAPPEPEAPVPGRARCHAAARVSRWRGGFRPRRREPPPVPRPGSPPAASQAASGTPGLLVSEAISIYLMYLFTGGAESAWSCPPSRAKESLRSAPVAGAKALGRRKSGLPSQAMATPRRPDRRFDPEACGEKAAPSERPRHGLLRGYRCQNRSLIRSRPSCQGRRQGIFRT